MLLIKKGINYTRNILDLMGLSWKEVYQTSNKTEAEGILKEDGISFKLIKEVHLRVKWDRPAFQKHSILNDRIWFNHCFLSSFKSKSRSY